MFSLSHTPIRLKNEKKIGFVQTNVHSLGQQLSPYEHCRFQILVKFLIINVKFARTTTNRYRFRHQNKWFNSQDIVKHMYPGSAILIIQNGRHMCVKTSHGVSKIVYICKFPKRSEVKIPCMLNWLT